MLLYIGDASVKHLELLLFSGGCIRGGEMLIVQWEYCRGLQVHTTEKGISKNDLKSKIMENE